MGDTFSEVMGMVAGPPQSKVMTPPLATAVKRASVQVPTTVVGVATLTAEMGGVQVGCYGARARSRPVFHGPDTFFHRPDAFFHGPDAFLCDPDAFFL